MGALGPAGSSAPGRLVRKEDVRKKRFRRTNIMLNTTGIRRFSVTRTLFLYGRLKGSDKLMALYKKAGAKYFVSMGTHHDNFFLWDSKIHKWNAVNMGPKKDVVGIWQEAQKSRV